MAVEHFRVITFLVYLASWLALAIAAVMGAIPRRRQGAAPRPAMTGHELIGLVLQCVSALPITLSLSEGPLRPQAWELVGAVVLAPLSAGAFWWAQRSAPGHGEGVVTTGAFAVVRHPMYAAFLAMLMATGLLASAPLRLAAGIALYLAGTELRVAAEEAGLTARFGREYEAYGKRTRSRYLPGIR
jgi:protein-S-isoprenylcysteine O-methyltransferase Ste14